MNVLAVLPAYNEAQDLPRLLVRFAQVQSLLPCPLQVIVVDDASTDATSQVAQQAKDIELTLLRHEHNRGLGGALLTGLGHAAAHAKPDDVIVTMDADDTHNPTYIPSMLDAMDKRELDVVVASRYAPGARQFGVSPLRKVASRCAGFIYRVAFPIQGLMDFSCGYRAFRAGVLQQAFTDLGGAFIRERGFQATGEIILNLRHYTQRYGEVPFDLHYEWKHGASKMRLLRTGRDTMTLLRRLKQKPVPTDEEKALRFE